MQRDTCRGRHLARGLRVAAGRQGEIDSIVRSAGAAYGYRQQYINSWQPYAYALLQSDRSGKRSAIAWVSLSVTRYALFSRMNAGANDRSAAVPIDRSGLHSGARRVPARAP